MATRKEEVVLIVCDHICVGDRSSTEGKVLVGECGKFHAASVLLKSTSVDMGRGERAAFFYSVDARYINNLRIILVN